MPSPHNRDPLNTEQEAMYRLAAPADRSDRPQIDHLPGQNCRHGVDQAGLQNHQGTWTVVPGRRPGGHGPVPSSRFAPGPPPAAETFEDLKALEQK